MHKKIMFLNIGEPADGIMLLITQTRLCIGTVLSEDHAQSHTLSFEDD